MNILYINFNFPPSKIGGVSIYTHNLMLELAKRGHFISCFYSDKTDLWPKPYLAVKRIGSLKYIRLVNSPFVYPPIFNSIEDEISNQQFEKYFRETLHIVRPDIVHIQDFYGMSTSTIQIAKEYGAVVVTSLHNYYPICPSFNLFRRRDNTICSTFNCEECISKEIPINACIKKFVSYCPDAYNLLCKIFLGSAIKNRLFTLYRVSDLKQLLNKRRQSYSDAINSADLSLAVSQKVKELYIERLNIYPRKIQVNHIGTKASEFINRTNRQGRQTSILRFVFLGRLAAKKGFQNVMHAFMQLDQAKASLLVYADLDTFWANMKVELEKKYNIKFMGKYNYENLSIMLSQADIGIVSPIWHDNSPQVLFEMLSAGLPVIGSNVGGIPDFITHGKNGLLYQYDDVNDLKDKMLYCVQNPEILLQLKQNIPIIKTMKDHAAEIESIYSRLIKNLLRIN